MMLVRSGATLPVKKDEGVVEVYENEEDFPKFLQPQLPLAQKIMYWKKANEVFFGPDRDVKNYPHFQTRETIPETYQFYLIPTRWFMNLYPRLGVSGCYSFVLFSFWFLLGKELVSIHEMLERGVVLFVAGFLVSKVGIRWGRMIDKETENLRVQWYENPLNTALSTYNSQVAAITQKIDTQQAVPIIYTAKQETLDLQLEAQYRQRVKDVFTAVKNRLDYQAAREAAERKFEQQIMVNWIVDGVKSAITPQQQKETLQSCIKTLQGLAKTASL